MIQGYDLSDIQGELTSAHWEAIAASGIKFVYLRAGNGNDSPDLSFDAYVAGARAAGLVVGAYNFLYPLPTDTIHHGRDPVEQAQLHFGICMGLGGQSGELPPAADLEWPLPQDWAKWDVDAEFIVDWTGLYLEKVESLWGRKPIIYTFPWMANELREGESVTPALGQYDLWLASYGISPVIPLPWNSFAMRQTSGGGAKLPNGCPVDTDECTEEAFATLIS
jgi:lysozyme